MTTPKTQKRNEVIRIACAQCHRTRPPEIKDIAPCPYCGCTKNVVALSIPDNQPKMQPQPPLVHPEFGRKCVSIYYPSFVIDNPQTLTLLTLFNDQVLLFSRNSPDETWKDLGEKSEDNPIFRAQQQRLGQFMRGPFSILSKSGVLRVITSNDFDAVFPEAGQLEVRHRDILAIVKAGSPESSNGTMTVGGLIRSLNAQSAARRYGIPLVTDWDSSLPTDMETQQDILARLTTALAASSLSRLAAPDILISDPEDILLIRDELAEQLAAFRSGILDLTWLLRQTINNPRNLSEVLSEANNLTETKIKARLLDLEQRLRAHKATRMRRVLFGAGRVLINAVKLFLPGDSSTRLLAGGKSLFHLAKEIDATTPPADQIASFIYQLREKSK